MYKMLLDARLHAIDTETECQWGIVMHAEHKEEKKTQERRKWQNSHMQTRSWLNRCGNREGRGYAVIVMGGESER